MIGQRNPARRDVVSMIQRLIVVIVCVACMAIPLTLGASCQIPGPPCEELANADLVFVAEVMERTSVNRTDEQGRPYPDGVSNYRFRVLENLKGADTGEF